jgi:hypothetical protein
MAVGWVKLAGDGPKFKRDLCSMKYRSVGFDVCWAYPLDVDL